MRTLYQFPVSHYCEKARWCLDHKGLKYRLANLIPGLHRRKTQRLAAIRTLPILVDDDEAIGDSTGIALYLEQAYPAHPLFPLDEEQRVRILELDAIFNRAGVHVRRWIYGQILTSPDLMHVVFGAYPKPVALIGRMLAPLVRAGLRDVYRLKPAAIERSRDEMMTALKVLDDQLRANNSGYLVGEKLTLADITAASMFGPLLGPKGSPWEDLGEIPETLGRLRAELTNRPSGRWVHERYRTDRHSPSLT
jgi:glutathione S-transferase